jgi:hypothetical protein
MDSMQAFNCKLVCLVFKLHYNLEKGKIPCLRRDLRHGMLKLKCFYLLTKKCAKNARYKKTGKTHENSAVIAQLGKNSH